MGNANIKNDLVIFIFKMMRAIKWDKNEFEKLKILSERAFTPAKRQSSTLIRISFPILKHFERASLRYAIVPSIVQTATDKSVLSSTPKYQISGRLGGNNEEQQLGSLAWSRIDSAGGCNSLKSEPPLNPPRKSENNGFTASYPFMPEY